MDLFQHYIYFTMTPLFLFVFFFLVVLFVVVLSLSFFSFLIYFTCRRLFIYSKACEASARLLSQWLFRPFYMVFASPPAVLGKSATVF